MTKQELKELSEQVRGLVYIVKSNQENFNKKVEELEGRIEDKIKKSPSSLEHEILRTAQSAINDSIKNVLTQYNSPLIKLVESAVANDNAFLKNLIQESFSSVIRTEDFRAGIVAAFSHKIGRAIIAGDDSLFQKCTNELKNDPVFRSKMVIAISNLVEETINIKKQND